MLAVESLYVRIVGVVLLFGTLIMKPGNIYLENLADVTERINASYITNLNGLVKQNTHHHYGEQSNNQAISI